MNLENADLADALRNAARGRVPKQAQVLMREAADRLAVLDEREPMFTIANIRQLSRENPVQWEYETDEDDRGFIRYERGALSAYIEGRLLEYLELEVEADDGMTTTQMMALLSGLFRFPQSSGAVLRRLAD